MENSTTWELIHQTGRVAYACEVQNEIGNQLLCLSDENTRRNIEKERFDIMMYIARNRREFELSKEMASVANKMIDYYKLENEVEYVLFKEYPVTKRVEI